MEHAPKISSSRGGEHQIASAPCGKFVGGIYSKALLIGFLIPFVFIAINQLQITLVSIVVADFLIRQIAPIWPVVLDNYSAMIDRGFVMQASNYSVFFVTILVSNAFGIFLAVRRYQQHKTRIQPPKLVEVAVILLLAILGYVVLSRLDDVRFEFKSLGGFYLDAFGLYLIKQYIILSFLLGFAPAALVIFAMKGADKYQGN